jgi:hypothetical protein
MAPSRFIWECESKKSLVGGSPLWSKNPTIEVLVVGASASIPCSASAAFHHQGLIQELDLNTMLKNVDTYVNKALAYDPILC